MWRRCSCCPGRCSSPSSPRHRGRFPSWRAWSSSASWWWPWPMCGARATWSGCGARTGGSVAPITGIIQNKFPDAVVFTRVDEVVNWAGKSSMWPMTFGLACCAIEMMAAGGTRYDWDRFGLIPRGTPPHNDLIIVAPTVRGPPGKKKRGAAKPTQEKLAARFGEKTAGASLEVLEPWVVVASETIAEVAAFVKADPDLRFDNLMCLSGVDYPKEKPPRMEVVYHLYSYTHLHTFVLKVHLPREDPALPTVEGTWSVANWHEREAYDMFGIVFTGHSDLRRILLPDDWEGWPLRKDWVDPEFYSGMRVKPTQQMMERALAGEAIGVGPFDF